MALPTLHRCAECAAAACGLAPEALTQRSGGLPEDIEAALDLFAWLAELLTGHNRLAIGLFVGTSDERVRAAIAAIEARRGQDRAFVRASDEMLLELHAEAEALARLGITTPQDVDPEEIIARLLGGHRDAARVTLAECRTLARAASAMAAQIEIQAGAITRLTRDLAAARHTPQLPPEPDAVARARVALDRALWTQGERHARERLRQALARADTSRPTPQTHHN